MDRISRHNPAHKAALVALAATAVLTLTACGQQTPDGASGNTSSSGKCDGYERTPFWCKAGGAGGGQSVGGIGTWDAEAVGNAHLIADVGREMGVPRRAIVIAIAAAMQESSLHNDACCDHDSVGLFQQRPSQGWGSWAECHDPRHSAHTFYNTLLGVPGWESMSLTRAAQTVQRSAYPDAYAKHEADANQLAG